MTAFSEHIALRRPAFAPFALGLALALALLLALVKPQHTGDVEEYALMTVAFASHGTPDIRPADIAAARTLLPAFSDNLAVLEQGMAGHKQVPQPGFYTGRDARVYSIHFFAYPLLAALPYKLLPLVGIAAERCFLAVNLAFVFVLGIALRRLFGSNGRAALGLLLFFLCGGALYLDWSSPECMSAAALLAALAFFATRAPLAGGALAGLAAMHNPPIMFFAGFAPLLRWCLVQEPGLGVAAGIKRALAPRYLAGALLAAGLFALSVLFNLWAFGVPSIIGRIATSVDLATVNRLHSFFFDLSQGMVVGVPGLMAALVLWGWAGQSRSARLRMLALMLAATLFTVALAVPALVAQNWNSGCEGMMRYAFWAAMPLLFALLWRLRQRERWPVALLAALLAVQFGSMKVARSYDPGQFSPLAKAVLAHAPGLYNPDPEIFHERVVHAETWLDENQLDRYVLDGAARKIMFNVANPNANADLCGTGRALAPGARVHHADRGWRYVDGPVPCVPASELLVGQRGLALGAGWSGAEHGGGEWNGAWSDGPRALLTIALAPRHRATHLSLHGHYYGQNRMTRVRVDGADLGWQALDKEPLLPVPATGMPGQLLVELQFDAPHVPPPGQADQRHIAFFLQKVTLR